VLRSYLARVGEGIPDGRLHVMTSAGGLVSPVEFRPKDGLLSGPAGGVVGAARAGRRSGFTRLIAFDMGGTSTDVARIDGEPEYTWEHRVGGAHLRAPALAIETVAAGGGSVCSVGAAGLTVGPGSAGAEPGPACYGAGGPLTLTDVNLLLGRLESGRFEIPVDRGAAESALESLRARLDDGDDDAREAEPLLEGLVEIANERMADAIRAVSLRRGFDPAEYALVAFGGAGGQHACGVAARLGISTVLVPADAGLLSALGLDAALVERIAERQVLLPLEEALPQLFRWTGELAASATAAVHREGVALEDIDVRRRIATLRFAGQDTALPLELEPVADLAERFRRLHVDTYGHAPGDRIVELEALRVVASARAAAEEAVADGASERPAEAIGSARAWLAGEWREVALFDREGLPPGARVAAPALVREAHGTTLVEPGWEAEVDGAGALVLRGRGERPAAELGSTASPEVVRDELFVGRFRALVGEMGEVLRRTALSTNVKERLDFSCGLLDARGALVVNAPHIPVHLGALGECVRRVHEVLPLGPGDVAITNHPAYGGSHLPDVTVITPVFGGGDRLLGYVASRAHHAEIGGTRPGSMPPDATRLAEEGVVIHPMKLMDGGQPRWKEVRRILETAAHPSRAVEDNLADLAAQVAANHRGAALLQGMAEAHGVEEVAGRMQRLQDRAASRLAEALDRLGDGVYEAEERLDDGSPLHVRISVEGERATFDFAGSAAVHPGNLNATPAVVRSVVLYVLRLLVREPLPLNEGLLRAVEIRIPQGILSPSFGDDPESAPAVVGGNTETSQRLVDVLLRALGLCACGQGTMNNVLFGDGRFGYYETIAGGAGAGPGWPGESGVHVHMTNTRITDPEVLEHRYPVHVERFGLRRGSGGAGRWRGGEGVVRELRFLAPLSVSVLGQHRVERPYGAEGGSPGAAGRQRIVHPDGGVETLEPADAREVQPGDRLVIETPGGGGWGPPSPA
jgi:5-oxoprolinase (ATP-hydrolysing)